MLVQGGQLYWTFPFSKTSLPYLLNQLNSSQSDTFINVCKLLAIPYYLQTLDQDIDVFLKDQFVKPGNTKGGSITVPLTPCLTGLESAV